MPEGEKQDFLRRCVIVSITTIVTATILWFLWATAHALLLLFAAFMFAVGLDGLARLPQRLLSVSRHTAVVLVAITLLVILGGGLTLGSMNVASQAPRLQNQVAQSIDQIQARLQHYRIAQHLMGGSLSDGQAANTRSDSLGEELTGEISDAASVTLTTLTDLFVVVIIGMYLALQPDLYRRGLLHLLPPTHRKRAMQIAEEAGNAIRRWLSGRIISMTVVALASVAGLWLFNIPFPLLLGLIAGLLTFIPYLGAIASAVPALLVAGLHGVDAIVWVAALYLSLHVLEGYLLAPLIQKRAVSIAPAFLLTVQVLGGAVAGILGVALATPIALVAAVCIQLVYVRDVIGQEPHLPGEEPATD